uniref:Uncharacterized protein n=1 Tax=Oryza meridionalis TaxID=40149 RepID=A0A0E0EMH2_9ORYZ
MVKVEMAGERRKVANGGTNSGGRHAMGRRRGRGGGEGERAQRRRREGCGIEGGGMGRGARPSKRTRPPSSFAVGAASRMHGSTIVDCRRTGPSRAMHSPLPQMREGTPSPSPLKCCRRRRRRHSASSPRPIFAATSASVRSARPPADGTRESTRNGRSTSRAAVVVVEVVEASRKAN